MADVSSYSKKICCCSGHESTKSSGFNRSSDSKAVPDTLLDIAARVAAANVPFQRVEEICCPLPEPILSRIVYWSFPRSEDHIRMYSSFVPGSKCGSDDSETVQLPFDRGVKLLESGAVEDVLQIGRYLTGRGVGITKRSVLLQAINTIHLQLCLFYLRIQRYCLSARWLIFTSPWADKTLNAS